MAGGTHGVRGMQARIMSTFFWQDGGPTHRARPSCSVWFRRPPRGPTRLDDVRTFSVDVDEPGAQGRVRATAFVSPGMNCGEKNDQWRRALLWLEKFKQEKLISETDRVMFELTVYCRVF